METTELLGLTMYMSLTGILLFGLSAIGLTNDPGEQRVYEILALVCAGLLFISAMIFIYVKY